MIAIYDFDGTLTPYSLPQYDIIKKCGYTDSGLRELINKEKEKQNDLYDAYYTVYKNVLKENKIDMTLQNLCIGAENVTLNDGVEEFFRDFQNSETGVKHYIVTSGIQYYVERTKISKYIEKIYGVTFEQKDGHLEEIDRLVTDREKVNIIKQIYSENNTNKILYFGDGMTDKYAFEYIHSIGGKNVFIKTSTEADKDYNTLNKDKIIDKCFDARFGKNSELYNYFKEEIKKEQ